MRETPRKTSQTPFHNAFISMKIVLCRPIRPKVSIKTLLVKVSLLDC